MLVAGTQGAALQVLPFLKEIFADKLIFWDAVNTGTAHFHGYPVMHREEELLQYLAGDKSYIIAVGNPHKRHAIYKQFAALGAELHGFTCSTAKKSGIADQYDEGSLFLHNCYIEPEVIIGKSCFINVNAVICHGTKIGDFCEIGPDVTITGNCEIAAFTSIGAAATLIPGIKVGTNVTIGAGAVVTSNLPDNCVAAGNPAKILKYK